MINAFLTACGLDIRRAVYGVSQLPWYFKSYFRFKKNAQSDWPVIPNFPILNEHAASASASGSHYMLQDLWVARRIFELKPNAILDCGSRIDGFITNVATFRGIDVIDIRPLDFIIPNVRFIQADLFRITSDFPKYDCVTSLHVIEHFGLGRYGDEIDFDGWQLGLCRLISLVRPGGRLIISTPIGKQRVSYNAHRVFAPATLIDYVQKMACRIENIALIPHSGKSIKEESVACVLARDWSQINFDCMVLEMIVLGG